MPKLHLIYNAMKNQAALKSGFLSLSLRSVLIHGLQVISVFVLAKWLNPKDYGTFGIISAWVGVAAYFTDIGIMGALIKQERSPTPRQLTTATGYQFFVGLFFALVFSVFAARLAAQGGLDPKAEIMIIAYAATLPLGAMRAGPRLLLDRNLQFGILSKADLIEISAGYVIQIALAIQGWGVWSFVISTLCRVVIGTFILFWFHGRLYWPVPHWREIRKILPFGIPFQLNAALPALHALVLPVILARFLDISEVGYVIWAMALASVPVFLATNYNQVMFASLSRIQNSALKMKNTAGRGLELSMLGLALIFGLAASCGQALIRLLFDSKWAPAAEIFPMAVMAVGLSTARYLGAPLLNASGRPLQRLLVEASALILEFGAALVLIPVWGDRGYFLASAGSSLITLIVTALCLSPFLRLLTLRRFIACMGAALTSFAVVHHYSSNNLGFLVPLYSAVFFMTCVSLDFTSWHDFKLFWRVLSQALRPKTS